MDAARGVLNDFLPDVWIYTDPTIKQIYIYIYIYTYVRWEDTHLPQSLAGVELL